MLFEEVLVPISIPEFQYGLELDFFVASSHVDKFWNAHLDVE